MRVSRKRAMCLMAVAGLAVSPITASAAIQPSGEASAAAANQPAPMAGASASVSVSAASTPAPDPASVPDDERPIRKFRPERNMFELGAFGGIFLFSKVHDFYDPATAPQEPLRRVSPDLGVRAAFFPARFLGFELEFSALPGSKYLPGDGPRGSAFLYGFRGHAILQLPLYRVVPFLLGGYGLMGVTSPPEVAGKDVDPIGHYGAGVKYYFNRWVGLRLDVRHMIGAQAALQVDGTSHAQVLLGLSLTLNRAKPKQAPPPPPPDPDRDRDGFLNEVDRCPDEPGIAPDGCPDKDSDGDGIMDSVDKCPAVPGVEPDGCPPKDRDRDGFLDEVDQCPDEPGVAPDGCPLRDSDGDGILDPDDKCPTEPETRNFYQDADGCPDEVPKQVEKFTGVIRGIFFEFNSDRIQKKSRTTLDAAAKVLTDFPDIKIEISGHTDNVGGREYNLELSRRRAESVRLYLLGKGIAPDRITTRGAGPDEPSADNATASGRAKNRRIEFKLIQ